MAMFSVICIDCDSDFIDEQLIKQGIPDLEVVEIATGEEFFDDINQYLNSTESEYIFFLENTSVLDANHMVKVMDCIVNFPQADYIFTPVKYIDSEGVISHIDTVFQDVDEGQLFRMDVMIKHACDTENNVIGGLSSIVGKRTSIIKNLGYNELYFNCDRSMQKIVLLYNVLRDSIFTVNRQETVAYDVERMSVEDQRTENKFKKYFLKQYMIERGWSKEEKYAKKLDVKKEITFFYTDKGEYYNVAPIAEEAKKRGYEVRFTNTLDEKAEIGVYCQHVCRPENSKFSIVLLHDMLQGHNRWPDIWNIERWNKFDIGILPGADWEHRISRVSMHNYTHPRFGAYAIGYPKSDLTISDVIINRANEIRNKLGLQERPTILYAPSWENDEKEDDFVRALASLDVNLVVKQANWPASYAHIISNIDDMRKLHEGNYENLYYIETEESIMVALAMCDLVVSDESSVMVEALMYGKPSIAVYDWMIPDEVPSRPACVPIDYVHKCKKVELREKVQLFIDNKLNMPFEKEKPFFNNIGNVCKDIVDAMEYYLYGGKEDAFMKWKIDGKYTVVDSF